MANRKKPQITQMNADIKNQFESICVYLRYLRFGSDCDGPTSAPWKGCL
jgi:hypothetical protein